ncbi:MAG: MBL fold metallo-hydrolase [Acidimicrobiia bacterium]
MRFEQYYLECLSQASYVIGDETTGLAAVVDPRRDIGVYLADAGTAGLRIVYVIETHFHADFLSGHLELAAATGAEIVFGDRADPEFPARLAPDGERLVLGQVVLEVRHTPGHTPESMSIVVWEHEDDETPYGVLTGDTLFIGDVGRPDLLSSKGVSAHELAGQLYESLHTKLLTLPDATRVFPAHGAGSSCGKQLSTATVSTIGEQRRTNYALQSPDREGFIAAVTEGQNQVPGYFGFDAGLNRTPHELLDSGPLPAMSIDAAADVAGDGVVVLDVRPPATFAAAHLAGSVNIGLEGRFAEFAGTVIAPGSVLVLVAADRASAAEARTRLARIGYDQVEGAVIGPEEGFVDRPDLAQRASRLTARELAAAAADHDVQVLDVRSAGERLAGTVPDAVHIPMVQLRERCGRLDLAKPVVVYCAGGYRSSIAASVLRAEGALDVSDLLGGFAAYDTMATATSARA